MYKPVEVAVESKRLRAVARARRDLDEAKDSELQSLARLAAAHFGVPISLVSIVDSDHQYFAAKVGLPAVSSTPRVVSFCSHAVEARCNLVVPDAQADPRFQNNSLVTGDPRIRAYAGSPIYIDGQPIGTVCAIDRTVRSFSSEDLQFLQELAQLAATIITSKRWFADVRRNVKRLKRQERLLWEKAHFDSMTKLANREHFTNHCETMLSEAPEESALILLDLDGFKGINDTLGHAVGDQCLVEIGKAMRGLSRSADFAARLGGDEFAMLIHAENPKEAAEAVFARLQRALTDNRSDRGFDLGLSGGCALPGDKLQGFDALYKAADRALYAAKHSGKSKLCVYSDENDTVVMPVQRSFRHQFYDAIQTCALVPYYQPKWSLAEHGLLGFEALARWKTPDGRTLSPASFEKALNDPWLAQALAEHMVREVASDYQAAVNTVNLQPRMGINATAYELANPQFCRFLLDTLELHNVPLASFTVEVTENVMLGCEESEVFRSIHTLREAGVQIAFDDFGTGYGSLSHLATWPIDRIKFDRSMLVSALASERAMTVLKGMISTCKQLNLTVIIEGIETAQQAHLMATLGADVGQGYHYAKPFSRDQLQTYLLKHLDTPAAEAA